MLKGRRRQCQLSFRASGKLAIVCCKSACRWMRVHGSARFWMLTDAGEQNRVSPVKTEGGGSAKCREYGKIKLGLEWTRPVIVEVLVVDGQFLGFDLLLGIDVIKELGGVHLIKLGEAHFGNSNRCDTISIDEPDFSVTFDQSTKARTASWKWASGLLPLSWQIEYRRLFALEG